MVVSCNPNGSPKQRKNKKKNINHQPKKGEGRCGGNVLARKGNTALAFTPLLNLPERKSADSCATANFPIFSVGDRIISFCDLLSLYLALCPKNEWLSAKPPEQKTRTIRTIFSGTGTTGTVFRNRDWNCTLPTKIVTELNFSRSRSLFAIWINCLDNYFCNVMGSFPLKKAGICICNSTQFPGGPYISITYLL